MEYPFLELAPEPSPDINIVCEWGGEFDPWDQFPRMSCDTIHESTDGEFNRLSNPSRPYSCRALPGTLFKWLETVDPRPSRAVDKITNGFNKDSGHVQGSLLGSVTSSNKSREILQILSIIKNTQHNFLQRAFRGVIPLAIEVHHLFPLHCESNWILTR